MGTEGADEQVSETARLVSGRYGGVAVAAGQASDGELRRARRAADLLVNGSLIAVGAARVDRSPLAAEAHHH
jgi:hypothetical protein